MTVEAALRERVAELEERVCQYENLLAPRGQHLANELGLTPQQQLMMLSLLASPDGFRSRECLGVIIAHKGHTTALGRMTCSKSIDVQMMHCRRKLAYLGVEIVAVVGEGFRLMRGHHALRCCVRSGVPIGRPRGRRT